MTLRRITVLILWGALFAAYVNCTNDPDLGCHLKTGQFIFQHGIPYSETFSYTVKGRAMISHEYLFQAILWSVYKLGGLPLIMLIVALICVLILWIVYKTCVGQPYLAIYSVLLMFPVFQDMASARPQLATALMTAILIYIMEKIKDRSLSPSLFAAFPFIFILWVNLHGGYIYGLAILSVYAAGESLQQITKKNRERVLSWTEIRTLVISIGSSFLATGLNPNGFRLWKYLAYQMCGHSQQKYIYEWQSPNFHIWVYWPFLAMFCAILMIWVFTEKTPTFTEALLFLATGAAVLISVRHMPYFAVVNSPMLSRYLLNCFKNTKLYPLFSGSMPEPKPSRIRSAVHLLLLTIAVTASSAWIALQIAENDIAIKRYYPESALEYIRQKGLDKKRVFNDYNWGAYLLWHDIPVFIDGRGEAYNSQFMNQYFDTINLQDNWRKVLEKYKVDYILMSCERPMSVFLKEDPRWREVYRDNMAVIFVKNNSGL